MDLLNGVEDAFILAAKMGADPAKLEELRNQWKNLMSTVLRVGDHLIDKLGSLANTDPDETERLKFQSQRFQALNQTAQLLRRIKAPEVAVDPPDISEIKRILKTTIKDRLEAAVSGKPAPRSALTMVSSAEQLDQHRATNSERWLNDQLKWQVLDLSLQRRLEMDKAKLRQLKEEKQRMLLAELEARIDREVMLEIQADRLDEEAETILALADLPRKEVRSLIAELDKPQLEN
jgi:hypothetical protein